MANTVTFLRMFVFTPLVFYGIIINFPLLAITSLTFAFLSDIFDGFIARRLNQVTMLGKILDHLADKILIFGIFAIFMSKFNINFLILSPVIAIEILIIILATIPFISSKFRSYRENIESNIFGKTKFAIQCIGVILLLYHFYIFPISINLIYAVFTFSIPFGILSLILHFSKIDFKVI